VAGKALRGGEGLECSDGGALAAERRPPNEKQAWENPSWKFPLGKSEGAVSPTQGWGRGGLDLLGGSAGSHGQPVFLCPSAAAAGMLSRHAGRGALASGAATRSVECVDVLTKCAGVGAEGFFQLAWPEDWWESKVGRADDYEEASGCASVRKGAIMASASFPEDQGGSWAGKKRNSRDSPAITSWRAASGG